MHVSQVIQQDAISSVFCYSVYACHVYALLGEFDSCYLLSSMCCAL